MSLTSIYAERWCIEEPSLSKSLHPSSVKLCLLGGQLLLSLFQSLLPLLEQGYSLSYLQLGTVLRLQTTDNITLELVR